MECGANKLIWALAARSETEHRTDKRNGMEGCQKNASRLERRKREESRRGGARLCLWAAEGGGLGCVDAEAGVFVDAQNGKCKQDHAAPGMAPIRDRLGAQFRGRNLGTL